LAWGKQYQVRTITRNFSIVALKMWALTPKIAKIADFWYKFTPKGYKIVLYKTTVIIFVPQTEALLYL